MNKFIEINKTQIQFDLLIEYICHLTQVKIYEQEWCGKFKTSERNTFLHNKLNQLYVDLSFFELTHPKEVCEFIRSEVYGNEK